MWEVYALQLLWSRLTILERGGEEMIQGTLPLSASFYIISGGFAFRLFLPDHSGTLGHNNQTR
jgi:hypothetical protein